MNEEHEEPITSTNTISSLAEETVDQQAFTKRLLTGLESNLGIGYLLFLGCLCSSDSLLDLNLYSHFVEQSQLIAELCRPLLIGSQLGLTLKNNQPPQERDARDLVNLRLLLNIVSNGVRLPTMVLPLIDKLLPLLGLSGIVGTLGITGIGLGFFASWLSGTASVLGLYYYGKNIHQNNTLITALNQWQREFTVCLKLLQHVNNEQTLNREPLTQILKDAHLPKQTEIYWQTQINNADSTVRLKRAITVTLKNQANYIIDKTVNTDHRPPYIATHHLVLQQKHTQQQLSSDFTKVCHTLKGMSATDTPPLKYLKKQLGFEAKQQAISKEYNLTMFGFSAAMLAVCGASTALGVMTLVHAPPVAMAALSIGCASLMFASAAMLYYQHCKKNNKQNQLNQQKLSLAQHRNTFFAQPTQGQSIETTEPNKKASKPVQQSTESTGQTPKFA